MAAFVFITVSGMLIYAIHELFDFYQPDHHDIYPATNSDYINNMSNPNNCCHVPAGKTRVTCTC